MVLLMIDADHFKSIKDTCGQVTGDIVLRGIKDNMPSMGALTRYGGEEFAAIPPNCFAQHALPAAERVRGRVDA
ncbi:MAG: diguanylate cyclase [Betaproteobacteria bacterium]|jgi:diguanylate cyclase (GGDEF)-like protein|nr:MAG: diguanylate cyclase [Betaproteobacteria bacterium]